LHVFVYSPRGFVRGGAPVSEKVLLKRDRLCGSILVFNLIIY